MANLTNLVSYELNGVKESFANWISNLSPTDTPFVSMTGKEAVKNKYFQWQEDQLAKYGPNAFAEGSDAVAGTLKSTTVRQNVTQILRKTVAVSDTANALSSYGRGKELQYQIEKAGKEIKRDLEWAFLNNEGAVEGTGAYAPNTNSQIGSTFVGATLANSYDPTNQPAISTATGKINGARRTAGFRGLVATKGTPSPEDSTAVVHQDVKTAGTLTEDDLFTLTNALYLAGACPDIIMFHPSHAQFFSGLMEKANGDRIRMFDGAADTKINKYVSTLVDPLGCVYKLIPNRFMPIERIYFFRASDWTQMVLRAPQTQLLAKTGSHDKYMIEMEVGLRLNNQFNAGILEIGTPAANVPVTSVTVAPTTVTLTAGGAASAAPTVTVAPANATNKTGTWTITPTSVATINATTGVITPVAAGSATATFTTTDGKKTATIAVTVNAPTLSNIIATPTALTLSVATDATNGKTVTFAPDPAGAALGTLTIKTQPTAAQATATITGTTLTVKPVAAGPATSVVVTNGTKDVTVAVTVTA